MMAPRMEVSLFDHGSNSVFIFFLCSGLHCLTHDLLILYFNTHEVFSLKMRSGKGYYRQELLYELQLLSNAYVVSVIKGKNKVHSFIMVGNCS